MEVSSLGLFGGYVEKVARYIINLSEEAAYQRISSKYNINGYKRIYFIHIRKTAGTSLNQMLLSLGGEDGGEVYHKLGATLKRRLNSNGLVFTSNKYVLNKGNYFYGYSHTPIYDLKIPRDTYFITCFRDPVKRVISLYNIIIKISQCHKQIVSFNAFKKIL